MARNLLFLHKSPYSRREHTVNIGVAHFAVHNNKLIIIKKTHHGCVKK